jgi:hypothetical protein
MSSGVTGATVYNATMYFAVLAIHSLLRWLVLLTGVVAVIRALTGRSGPWTAADRRAGLLFSIALDLQFLVGLLLYFGLSDITTAAFGDMAATMRNAPLRFWAVEHPFGMIVALALVHIGRVRIRKAASDAKRHGLASMFFTLALIIIVLATPWPGTPNARPLLRW